VEHDTWYTIASYRSPQRNQLVVAFAQHGHVYPLSFSISIVTTACPMLEILSSVLDSIHSEA
jgi:hypothetical protein